MPDLITHLAGAYLAGKGFRLRRGIVLFSLGALLPDIVSRPLHIFWPRTFPVAQALHTPVVLFLICWLLSLFFRVDQRKTVFLLLGAGSLLHLLMDMFQKHLVGGYLWFFPFSCKARSFGFLSPESSLSFLPVTLLLVLAVYLFTQRGGAGKR